jgi:hypothetical protein
MSSEGEGKRQITVSFNAVATTIRDTTAELTQIRQRN